MRDLQITASKSVGKMNKITVAIASYNHAPFVSKAIHSALSQDGCDVEVIVVDDGSTDGTPDEVRKINDPRLRLICFDKNQGACIALNRAIQEGSGEYVAILNSDDAFMPNKLQKQLTFLETNPSIGAVFGLPCFIDDLEHPLELPALSKLFEQPNRSRYEWLRYFFYHDNALCHPTVLIRRECYNKYGYYDPRLVQAPDYDFWLRLLLKEEIHVLHEPLSFFRILPDGSNVSTPRPDRLRRSQWEVSQILKTYQNLSPLEYLKVFPEDAALANRVGIDKGKDFVSLALAYRALGDGMLDSFQSSYRLFGLQVLHNLLGQSNKKDMSWLMPNELSVKDFMHLTQKTIFSDGEQALINSNRCLGARIMRFLKRKVKGLFIG